MKARPFEVALLLLLAAVFTVGLTFASLEFPYRISRHPQYLGWILWSYGIYLLLLRMQYPRRSWGIDASLPWLISTMVIIGVALMEELSMRRLMRSRALALRSPTLTESGRQP